MASYERHGFGLYRVAIRSTDEAAGICGLLQRDWLECPDIGFAYLPRFRSRGYAFEAASAVLDHARTGLGIGRVAAITSPDNAGSIGLLCKLGFRFDRVARPAEGEPEVNVYIAEPVSGGCAA